MIKVVQYTYIEFISYNSRTVANRLLNLAESAGGLDALKLMKMFYLYHGWNLAFQEKPLIDDDVEAWRYGPVIRKLYDEIRGQREPRTVLVQVPFEEEMAPSDGKLICAVYDQYKKFSGLQLSQLTHQADTPWDQMWKKYGERNVVIPQDLIRSHFTRLLHERSN